MLQLISLEIDAWALWAVHKANQVIPMNSLQLLKINQTFDKCVSNNHVILTLAVAII